MSKELEAFNRIKSYFNPKQLLTKEKTLNDLDIVENALKENERLKTSYLENLLNEESKEYIYKKLKALQTLKTMFDINVFEFQGGYFLSLGISQPISISKEQFDLFNEVLL